METTEVIQQKRGTVVYERKKNLGDYESETAMVSVQFDIDDDEVVTSGRIEAAFNQAQEAVLDRLGLLKTEATAQPDLRSRPDGKAKTAAEQVKAAFPGITEVQQPNSAPKATGRQEPKRLPKGQTLDPSCKKCDGPMWDNRESKTKPTQPDFRCVAKDCDGAIWPEKKAR